MGKTLLAKRVDLSFADLFISQDVSLSSAVYEEKKPLLHCGGGWASWLHLSVCPLKKRAVGWASDILSQLVPTSPTQVTHLTTHCVHRRMAASTQCYVSYSNKTESEVSPNLSTLYKSLGSTNSAKLLHQN